ncbi:unnamed protein product [Mesocestoides corti]|uniref:Uncharacterized protein n=1 Tax=Mesocestoides corti TaxID=53468 RepID=A0A0R3U3U1_MESCO|nr:unnamed protein product [Mesocestoides corti]
MDRGDDCTPTRKGHARRDGGSRHVVKASQQAPMEKRICDTKSPDQPPTRCAVRHCPAADTGSNNRSENEQRSTSSRQVFTPTSEQSKTTETNTTASRPKEEALLAFQGGEVLGI